METSNALRRTRRRVVKKIGGRILWSLEKIIEKGSKVPNTPFLDAKDFPWVRQLEENWRVMQAEVRGVLKRSGDIPGFQDISRDQLVLTDDDRWKTFFLYGMGYRLDANCALCPETTRLVSQIPGMTTAFFSILAPGKHIPAHRGLFKGFVRYHLGLIVPREKEKCRIRVDDTIRHWEEGKSLLFDDTYDHEVWNETSETRVVLFVDVKRPLAPGARQLNDTIIRLVRASDYVQDARRNQEAWSQALARNNAESSARPAREVHSS
ncbi:MAG: aspartyl beta-hydroxylase [Bacteroidetes bacterium CG12_big_fil_rev_8_21_14_0_65_60_17]|nr:MAG: aspartyl beta-hydroxylase [Bacteroidetes bacterium CG12_big_fil_rev_8_21_14_0_65_60_17]